MAAPRYCAMPGCGRRINVAVQPSKMPTMRYHRRVPGHDLCRQCFLAAKASSLSAEGKMGRRG